MLREIDRVRLQVELILTSFLLKGKFSPLGELLIYLNDRTRNSILIDECELAPLAPDRQVRGVKQPSLVALKHQIVFLSLLESAQAQEIRILKASRPVVFYTRQFAVQGQLHVNTDARDSDLLDDNRDFFAVSNATIFPLEQLAQQPTPQVPLLLIYRSQVHTYHVRR